MKGRRYTSDHAASDHSGRTLCACISTALLRHLLGVLIVVLSFGCDSEPTTPPPVRSLNVDLQVGFEGDWVRLEVDDATRVLGHGHN